MKQISSVMVPPEDAHSANAYRRLIDSMTSSIEDAQILRAICIFMCHFCDDASIEFVREQARQEERKPTGSPHRKTAIALLDKIKSERTLQRIANYIELLWEQEP